MAAIEEIFPPVRLLRRLPLSRDQYMLLLMAVNMLFLGVDTYLAHSMTGTLRGFEWIPIIFSPIAGVILLAAGAIALRWRSTATLIGCGVFITSFLVGIAGTYFHLTRAFASGPAAGQAVPLLVWAPPALGPLAFCLTGWMGLSAIWPEDPPDSGRLRLLPGRFLQLPYSKTQAYFFLVGLGFLTCLLSSTLDHARTGFTNPWLWIPLAAGLFGTLVPILVGLSNHPGRIDLLTYAITMLLMILVGLAGGILHVVNDLNGQTQVVVERFLRGAPFLAPLLFANFGLLGLIALLDPGEEGRPA
jgi:hypothetical protein